MSNWNKRYPVGTNVYVKLDRGAEERTQTTSEAWLMGGHTAVVKLHGIAGGYSLERVTAIVPV